MSNSRELALAGLPHTFNWFPELLHAFLPFQGFLFFDNSWG